MILTALFALKGHAMKISSETIKKLAQAVKAKAMTEDLEDSDGNTIRAYFLQDLTLTFKVTNGRSTFYGLNFQTVGRQFTILQNLELLTTFVEDGVNKVFEVADQPFLNAIENYLRWRATSLETTQL